MDRRNLSYECKFFIARGYGGVRTSAEAQIVGHGIGVAAPVIGFMIGQQPPLSNRLHRDFVRPWSCKGHN